MYTHQPRISRCLVTLDSHRCQKGLEVGGLGAIALEEKREP